MPASLRLEGRLPARRFQASRRAGALFGVVAAAGLGWGYWEAGWVRMRTLDVPVPGLPAELRGVRIGHLSDFHLGVPGRGATAVAAAVDWIAARDPDVVAITGDLLSHPRGRPLLESLLARLPGALAVLGNHDVGIVKDPFARTPAAFDAGPVRVLRDASATVELRGRRVQLVGVDPATYLARRSSPDALVDGDAELRVLLSHYPRVVDRIPAGAFHLVLAGHVHDGQIALPIGRRKLRLADPFSPYPRGVFRHPSATLHVSPGLGTTFVPFRFFARPEATELRLQPA